MKNTLTVLSILLFAITLNAQVVFNTENLKLRISAEGRITELSASESNINYVPYENPGCLLRLRNTDKIELNPEGMKIENEMLLFSFKGGIDLYVRVTENQFYICFELVKIKNAGMIDAVIWGPFNSTINETIGEVVGVVRNKDFAIGIQALNPKTIGGKLLTGDGYTASFAGINGSTAAPELFGSSLNAFCMNNGIDRNLGDLKNYLNLTGIRIPGIRDYTLEGTAIAIFGAAPENVLSLISSISQAEGLPYPKIEGEWVRTSPKKNRPYLITGFTEENFDEMLNLTERLGFHSIYHEHPFENWGHFDLIRDQFPNGRAGMKTCVDKAKEKNIIVGVHTLTNFLTTNDPFVTSDENKRLLSVRADILLHDIDESATEIYVDDFKIFDLPTTLNSVLIGNEIIRYQEVTKQKPYKLINCVRGAFGTKTAAHEKGEKIKRLSDHPYKVFFPDWEMQDKMIQNLADFFNETGVSQLDFDGHEGALYSGYGDYGTVYFADEFVKHVDHPVVNGSSIMNHYYWHINYYINWGEPWYASFRESQSEHRFALQPFFERNYMPNMLGWFLVTPSTSAEDVEWMMSVSAGYNAGYALVLGYEAYKNNPSIDNIINTITVWEEAKRLGIFTEEQRAKLKDTKSDFHLDKISEKEWALHYFEKFGFEHRKRIMQPGEPDYTRWQFENTTIEQPIHLHLMVTGDNAVAENIEMEIDNFCRLQIPVKLEKGQSLVWDGSGQVKLYSEKGKFIRNIVTGKSLPFLGKGLHSIDIKAGNISEETVVKGTVKLKGNVETIKL